MFPLTEGSRRVAQLLFKSGTCPRCIFRFCGVDLPAPYKHPSKELLNDLQKFLEPEKHELILETPKPPLKKIRLHEDGADNLSEDGKERVSVTEDESMAAKPSKMSVCNVCLGILQGFCEKGFITEVCQKRKQSLSLGRNDVVQLKEAYKWIAHPLFSEELGVPTDGKVNQYFLTQFPCPPNSPKTVCTVLEVECTHGAVFVAGRYNKYSRNLPQTPWIIDGERKMETSVEELISDHLLTVFKAESFNFSSSGREDVDVRTLGNGKQKINTSSDKIQVRDLQLVTREAIGRMKEGEEEKTKTYSALIWTNEAIQKKDIGFLDDLKDLKIDQKTPLRVLHRRPLAVRTRAIHCMETHYLDEHHFRLRLKTQAGTYPSASVET
ncbi:tRNA pseudouridine synthase Pus10 [Apodemus speciosus]|uniref:tRNA pseudouridine(55) synthase n=1 Tax=Apodemus speciosus TaxID=105296 RepID=A0ABQ0F9N4_APOSI